MTVEDFKQIALEVGEDVFAGISHDHLRELELCRLTEYLDADGPILELVWCVTWQDGHADEFKVMLPEQDIAKRQAALREHLTHRLMREVFIEDSEISASEPAKGSKM